MLDKRKIYINGEWVDPVKKNDFEVINPCNEDPCCLLYTSPSPRDVEESRMPSSA